MSAEHRCRRAAARARRTAVTGLTALAVTAALGLALTPTALGSGGLGYGGPQVTLTALQCAQPGTCAAVGDYYDALGNGQAAAWSQTDGVWAPGIKLQGPSNAADNAFDTLDEGGEVATLACPSSGDCTAGGEYLDRAGNLDGVLFDEHGGRWSAGFEARMPADAFVQRYPSPGAETAAAIISGVACVSVGNCVAIGYYLDNAAGIESAVFLETDGAWSTGTTVEPPAGSPTGSVSDELTAIDCVSDGTCTAAGTYTDTEGNQQGWVVTFDGSATPVTDAQLPMPSGPDTTDTDPTPLIDSISCWDADDCAAVGDYVVDDVVDGSDNPNLEGLLLSESSGDWSAAEATLPSDAEQPTEPEAQTVDLLSVDCTATDTCAAVGYYVDTSDNIQGALIDETSGSWGAAAGMALPDDASSYPGTQFAAPGPVSCAAPGDCAASAVYANNAGNYVPLLAVESSGSWSSVLMQPPANAGVVQELGGLDAVSCPTYGTGTPPIETDDDCTVLGAYEDGGGNFEGFATGEDSGGVWGSPVELQVPAPDAAELRLSLSSVLEPKGRRARIKRIAQARGYAFTYTAVERGTLTIAWHANYRGHGRLIGSVAIHPRGSGNAAAKLRLTAVGRLLLKGSRRVRVSARVAFIPSSGARASATANFTLKQ